MLLVVCDASLNHIFYVIKMILKLFMIVSPILEIISLSVLIFKLVNNPDDKKLIKNLQNAIIALFFFFFVPVMVEAVMSLVGDNSSISSCWNQATEFEVSTNYQKIDENEDKRKNILTDPDDYEKGSPKQMKFECTSNIVKSQFSCETLRIVEKHLNDFNCYNFYSVISSYGGFANYAKSLGGVFAKYYGRTINATTVYEFQEAAEYVFGFMYMYGMDYYNSGAYHNWGVGYGQSGHSSDAFYPGNSRAEHWAIDFDSKFDEVISGANGRLWMATECGPSANAPLYKAGILKAGQRRNVTYITKLRDLRPGDVMYFFDQPVGNKQIRSTWGTGRHNVLIGEVYDDKIVIYDGGSHYQTTRNFKREIRRPQNDSEEYESIFGYGGWAAERFGNLEQ